MPEAVKYDAFKARCVSHNDLHQMFSDDGPTRANMLCLIDCLKYGFHEKDTRRAPLRIARSGAPASHDSVVKEVMDRLGPALAEQIAAAVAAGVDAKNGGFERVDAPPHAGGNGGGNGAEAAIMEPPPVPAGYGQAGIHQPSEVFGKPEDVDPEDFKGGLALAKDTTDLSPQPHPKPLTEAELANLRSILASGQAPTEPETE